MEFRGTFCEALVLVFSSAPVLLLCSSVGARCDWFVQLQVQRRRAELQATVAGLTDAAGLKQLLAWHWDLLVAAAGAEHVTTVPAVGRRQVITAPSHTLYSPHAAPSQPINPLLESCSSNTSIIIVGTQQPGVTFT